MSALPGILAEIADVAGEDAALAVAGVRGGTEVYFPPVPANDHWLCRLIGRDQAKAVCARVTDGHPLRAMLPLASSGVLGRARQQRDEMLRAGRSERDIALATGYTVRSIRRRRAALALPAPEDRQLPLL